MFHFHKHQLLHLVFHSRKAHQLLQVYHSQERHQERQQDQEEHLKKNIKFIRKSLSGINIYQFRYIKSQNMPGLYEGVIAQELLGTKFENAVIMDKNGYYLVDYSKIDVKFKKLI